MELISKLNSRNSYENSSFEKKIVEVLDKHAPKRGKFFVIAKTY